MLVRLLFFLLLSAGVTPATAGLRAVYGGSKLTPSIDIRISDDGDFVARTGQARMIVRKGGETFIIEELYTGPRVTRLLDLRAVVTERAGKPAAHAPLEMIARGRRTVAGLAGDAFSFPSSSPGDPDERDLIVVSRDPALAALGSAMHEIWLAQALETTLYSAAQQSVEELERAVEPIAGASATLQYDDLRLLSLNREEVADAAITLPAAPETLAALRRRIAAEATDSPRPNAHITRGAFFDGRLWLTTSAGRLLSIADRGDALQKEDPGGKVADLCASGRGLVALTGTRYRAKTWVLRARLAGHWRTAAVIPTDGEALVALSCEGSGETILTSRRAIALNDGRLRTLRLSRKLDPARVMTTVHVTPDALYVGRNDGEWGGGLERIDRGTGAVTKIERKEDGGPCSLPLDGGCDPVNAVATTPWRGDCVIAAVGLVHMAPHGRLVSVCGGTVTLFYAKPLDPYAETGSEAFRGGWGAVPFYGLAATGAELIAVGGDGLYRFGAAGQVVRQPFPRFRVVGDVLVSFDLPSLVLVLTDINRQASLSGSAPMLVAR